MIWKLGKHWCNAEVQPRSHDSCKSLRRLFYPNVYNIIVIKSWYWTKFATVECTSCKLVHHGCMGQVRAELSALLTISPDFSLKFYRTLLIFIAAWEKPWKRWASHQQRGSEIFWCFPSKDGVGIILEESICS